MPINSLTDYAASSQILDRDKSNSGVQGMRWGNDGWGERATVSFSFVPFDEIIDTGEPGTESALNPAERNQVRFGVVNRILDVADLTLNYLGINRDAQIQIQTRDQSFGESYSSYDLDSDNPDQFTGQTRVTLAQNFSSGHALHEFLHALGLYHPGDYNNDPNDPSQVITYDQDADYIQDSRQYTIMSYFGANNTGANWNRAGNATLMLHDVMAIQRLYGANDSAFEGDTRYGFNSNTGRDWWTLSADTDAIFGAIWDTGGTDTIDASGYTVASVIDLNATEFSSLGGTLFNLSIAPGALIENAIGGGGDDSLIGNSGYNTLEGRRGNDTLIGGFGDDTMIGGRGNDLIRPYTGSNDIDGGLGFDIVDYSNRDSRLIIDLASGYANLASGGALDHDIARVEGAIGGSSRDTISGGSGANHLDGERGDDLLLGLDGADTLIGGTGDDSLYGGLGDDWLSGGDGEDSLNGGAGFDTADYGYAAGDLIIDLAAQTAARPGYDPEAVIEIEAAIAGSGDDTLIGDGSGNRLDGGIGNDTLRGGGNRDTLSGGQGDDSLSGNASRDQLAGNAGADTLRGNGDNDTLAGGWGADALYGGLGNDSLLGDAGTDLIQGGNGNDTLRGHGGNDTLAGGNSADRLVGGNGSDRIEGGSGNDTLRGQGGGDWLEGGNGNDHLMGNNGNDTLIAGFGFDIFDGGAGFDDLRFDYSDADWAFSLHSGTAERIGGGTETLTGIEALLAGGGDDSLYGSNEANTLRGGAGRDTVWGLDGDDTLRGNAGSDQLRGGSGDDVIEGGGGDDLVIGDVGTDSLAGGAGNDTVSYAYSLARWVIDLDRAQATSTEGTESLTGFENAVGGAGDDLITGDDRANRLWGHYGADTIDGGAGNDRLYGDGGDDSLIGGAGDDTLMGDIGADSLDGGAGNDWVSYDGDPATLPWAISLRLGVALGAGSIAESLRNIENAQGGAGDDTITGTDAANSLTGGDGNDALNGLLGSDVLRGSAGNDTLTGDRGHDTLIGGADNDALDGGRGNDVLRGRAGDDTLTGGIGQDRFSGGTGNDLLISQGDGARDVFLFADGFGIDTVTGFETGTDLLDLTGWSAIDGFADLTIRAAGTSAEVLRAGSNGNGPVLGSGDGAAIIVLEDISASTLGADDFLFA